MMNDKELLELAAKAAGLLPLLNGQELDYSKNGLMFCGNGECITWEPLTDDGDALRLAVKLNVIIYIVEIGRDGWTSVTYELSDEQHTASTISENWNGDKQSATRRAIVCAASKIGRSMK